MFLGGDSDTQACIAGGIAEAFYGVPKRIEEKAWGYLDDELQSVLLQFESKAGSLSGQDSCTIEDIGSTGTATAQQVRKQITSLVRRTAIHKCQDIGYTDVGQDYYEQRVDDLLNWVKDLKIVMTIVQMGRSLGFKLLG